MGEYRVFYPKNITPDAETGIGAWTDDEIFTGHDTRHQLKCGDTLFPIMAYPKFQQDGKRRFAEHYCLYQNTQAHKNKNTGQATDGSLPWFILVNSLQTIS